jgi:mono/diheme cytochrome c family protein
MKKKAAFGFLLLIFFVTIFIHFSCTSNKEKKSLTREEMIAKGKYLVDFGGCNYCHSPKIFTNLGPVPDKTRLLSGYPEDEKLQIDNKIDKSNWIYSNLSGTAWVGAWGVSFASNLTPDKSTGLGTWTEEIFVETFWTGKQMGHGRNLLPPMPWQAIGQLKDEDLKSIFAYLQSLPPIKNQVPAPIPPNMVANVK